MAVTRFHHFGRRRGQPGLPRLFQSRLPSIRCCRQLSAEHADRCRAPATAAQKNLPLDRRKYSRCPHSQLSKGSERRPNRFRSGKIVIRHFSAADRIIITSFTLFIHHRRNIERIFTASSAAAEDGTGEAARLAPMQLCVVRHRFSFLGEKCKCKNEEEKRQRTFLLCIQNFRI